MKFGIFLQSHIALDRSLTEAYDQIMEQVNLMEKSGFDRVWVGDHHAVGYYYLPMFTLASAIASRTQMGVGTGICLLPLYNPALAAESVAMLDIITKGRFIFGVAIGYRKEECELYGVPFEKRAAIFEESLSIVDSLLTHGKVNFKGKHFRLDSSISVRPVQKPRPPIWIAGKADGVIKRAGRMGDGLLAPPYATLAELRKMFGFYKTTARESGRDPSKVALALQKDCFVAKDTATARGKMKMPYLKRYRTYTKWNLPGRPFSVPDLAKSTPEELDAIFDKMISEGMVVVGNPDECTGMIERHIKETGVADIQFKMQFEGATQKDALESIRLFGSKIIPYFRGAGK